MSQEQPSSLPHWRERQKEVGCDRALREAALEVDRLSDEVGRKIDRSTAKDIGLFIFGLIAGITLCAMNGCTTVSHEKVHGWPTLTVYEHHVPHAEMRDRCAKYAPFGTFPEACAVFNLVERRCDIYFSADFPPPKAFIEHERLHCQGYDHVGETNMRDFLARFQGSTQ